ncbi:putative phage tail protein [Caproicibacterium argilliputei]|uniref:Phage tail protein n=2 Tax=Caproicibacterium TaxID=2834348 RepID=A0AA97DC80_9FIRM|nr:putative phage tail protein [Caproicibacterium argilliputei]WOC33642.1 putative phage tail protein [Caproicibacterium argilliputei]
MDEILTSPAARRIVPQLSPVYGDAYVALWLFNAIGQEIDNMDLHTQELPLQALPQTATWGIPFWEEDYGIARNDNLPMEERRREVLSRIRTRAPMNPQWIKTVLQTLTGTSVQITENISKNRFEVIFGNVLENAVKGRVRDKLEEIKPAHLIYLIAQTIPIIFREKNTLAADYQALFHFDFRNALRLRWWTVHFTVAEVNNVFSQFLIPVRFLELEQVEWHPSDLFFFRNREFTSLPASCVSFSLQNRQRTDGTMTYNRPWKFNGKIKFNGKQKFNSGVTKEEF